ncbi:GNAT family N-acetyltransferase [Thermodesulfobacteriota bacterium]
MAKVRVCEEIEECRHIWENHWPKTCLFDLWPVRACFQSHFNNPPYFLVAEKNEKIQGLLALSWIDEIHSFGHFPGEIWQGKTWLEQNKIMASNSNVFNKLMSHIPASSNIRYLTRESLRLSGEDLATDETGYLFFPKRYGYSFENYMQQFPGKSRKKLVRELERLQSLGLKFRHDDMGDISLLFRMNQEAFGEWSYFRDSRFLNSFEQLAVFLKNSGMLRITTALLGGKVAAVDMGALYGSTYTVLAGATNPDFPGIAKLINFHHLDWACKNGISTVDFLCGNFGWKERFRLTPRPLYAINTFPKTDVLPVFAAQERQLRV